MHRVLMSVFGCVLAATLVVAAMTVFTAGEATAADDHALTLEVALVPKQGAKDGDTCGTVGQVLVADAAGAIVGTMDLVDVTTLFANGASYPGTVDADGLCWVKATMTVPDSPFYTFSIDHERPYTWTVSRDRLETLDWRWQVDFIRFT